MFLKFSARRHVKALAPSKFPSFSAAFCVPECLRVCFTHSLPFQVCAFAYNIPSVCVCVYACLSQTVWCSLAKALPPSPTLRGILYHVSVVFRELSRKIKHRGLIVPTTTTPPKHPPQLRLLLPPLLVFSPLTHSMRRFFMASATE